MQTRHFRKLLLSIPNQKCTPKKQNIIAQEYEQIMYYKKHLHGISAILVIHKQTIYIKSNICLIFRRFWVKSPVTPKICSTKVLLIPVP